MGLKADVLDDGHGNFYAIGKNKNTKFREFKKGFKSGFRNGAKDAAVITGIVGGTVGLMALSRHLVDSGHKKKASVDWSEVAKKSAIGAMTGGTIGLGTYTAGNLGKRLGRRRVVYDETKKTLSDVGVNIHGWEPHENSHIVGHILGHAAPGAAIGGAFYGYKEYKRQKDEEKR